MGERSTFHPQVEHKQPRVSVVPEIRVIAKAKRTSVRESSGSREDPVREGPAAAACSVGRRPTEPLLEETVVVVHLQLALHLAHGVQRHADHNEDGRTAESLDELVVGEVEDDGGHHGDQSDEDAAGQRHAVQDVLDVLHGGGTGAHAGDEAAVLAQVVARLLGIEHHGGRRSAEPSGSS